MLSHGAQPLRSSSHSDALPPTEVCITVDTEFSIAGAFADPARYRPLSHELVDCIVGERSEGLDFLLGVLRDFRVPATFFIEVLQCHYFGEQPMGRIVERIGADGHNLQLHLHPGWSNFAAEDWRDTPPRSDNCAERSYDELRHMIDFGMARFAAWQIPQPKALRAGSFAFASVVHRAMSACGLALGSNIGLALYRPREPEFHLASGTCLFGGVLEVPALSYSAISLLGRSQLRLLAITSTSRSETEALLWSARRSGISPVIVLTHPFEFIKNRDFRCRETRRNKVNQGRLEQLLDFLTRNPDAFRATTFAKSGDDWMAARSRPSGVLQAPPALTLMRVAENAANTLIWRY